MEKRSSFKFDGLNKEKIQSSCMRKLADALNCKDDTRNSQKLLSNGKAFGNNNGSEADQSKQAMKKSMKKQHQSSGFDQLQKNHKKPSQTSEKMDQNPKSHCEDTIIPENQLALWSDEMSADKQKLAETLNEICHQIYQDGNGENLRTNISPSNFNQLDEASRRRLELRTKAFIHQIYISRIYKTGDDGSHSKSKQFLDAAEILRLNMDVFLKFLRDPYTLFLKNIRSLQFLPRSNSRKKLSLESKSSESRSCIVGNHQDLKGKVKTHESDPNRIVQRKLKYENLSSTQGLAPSQLSNKTLAFMSKLRVKNKAEDVQCDYSSVQSHQNLKNKNQTTKATNLSFKDVKQTIKQAVGENKKKLRSSLNSKMAHIKASSDDVDEGINAMRRENKLKPVDLEGSNEPQPALIGKTLSKKMKSVFTGNRKKQQADMSVETKQQLSERLKNAHLDEVLPKKELASSSPNRHNNHVSPQKGFYYSRHNTITGRNLEIRVSNDPKKVEFKSSILDKTNAGTKEVVHMCSSTSDSKSCGTLEANSVVPPGNTKVLAMLYEPMRVDVTSNERFSTKIEAVKARAENRLYRSFLEPPSSPLHIRKLQIADGIEDKEENTSPISVLEPFSPHDVSSSTSIVSEPAASSLKQSRFHFDRASLDTCMDRKDTTLYLYVRNIIQFSGMNFQDLFVKRASLERTMKSCPDDGIASLAIELKCDYKLLLDCIHEAIRGVYRRYSRRIQRLPVIEQDRVIPLEEKFIDEVVKQVEFRLLEETEQIPIDQLVGKDLAMCSSSWFDVVNDTEDILIKVAEGVLLDSIVDTILEVQF